MIIVGIGTHCKTSLTRRNNLAMVYYVANNKGIVIARSSTVTRLEPSEYDVIETKERMSDPDTVIEHYMDLNPVEQNGRKHLQNTLDILWVSNLVLAQMIMSI